MEALQPINDDKDCSDTFSGSKNLIVPEIIQPQTTPLILVNPEQLPREIEFLRRHRNKTRLCDPKGVYEFRHIQQTWLQSLIQLMTLLISMACIVGLYYLYYLESKQIMVGVGEVSELTWIDAFEVVMIIGIIFMAIKNIAKQSQLHPQKRYCLAMFANCFNRMWLNTFCLHLSVLVLILSISAIQDPTLQSVNIEMFEEGSAADLANAVYSLVLITICFRAFRFCGKELTA